MGVLVRACVCVVCVSVMYVLYLAYTRVFSAFCIVLLPTTPQLPPHTDTHSHAHTPAAHAPPINL